MRKKLLVLILAVILSAAGCANQPESPESSAVVDVPQTSETSPAAENVADEPAPEISTETEVTEINPESNVNLSADVPENDTEGFTFAHNGVVINPGEYVDRVVAELEPAADYYEYESCSFDGIAKMYFYNGFEIETYLKAGDGEDRVYSVSFTDDSVATAEGIYIGQTFNDMTAIYGTSYEELPGGTYMYEQGGTILFFGVHNNVIESISYQIADMYT